MKLYRFKKWAWRLSPIYRFYIFKLKDGYMIQWLYYSWIFQTKSKQ